ncbi:hypothetical protein PM082_011782 [Marasmius tenuissimus]|nr:hypothetical protein PM082_011782 [Marasmius tenuissimus]
MTCNGLSQDPELDLRGSSTPTTFCILPAATVSCYKNRSSLENTDVLIRHSHTREAAKRRNSFPMATSSKGSIRAETFSNGSHIHIHTRIQAWPNSLMQLPIICWGSPRSLTKGSQFYVWHWDARMFHV